jgi:hypothetical protein
VSLVPTWLEPDVNQWRKRDDYYADAVVSADQTRVHLLLAAIDLWDCEPVHVTPAPAVNQRPVATIFCCGQTRQARGWPCQLCDEPDCSICHKCGCDRALDNTALCLCCRMVHNAALVVNGVCVDCQ